MKLFFVTSIILVCLLSSSCKQANTITHKKDYEAFLTEKNVNEKKTALEQETNFWKKKLSSDTGNYVYKLEMAKCLLKKFNTDGDIIALHNGDSLLKASSYKINNTVPEILFAQAQNSIRQHQFKNALQYVNTAEKMKGDLYTSFMLQFDVHMELGNYYEASKALNKINNNNSFDYLIRKAKWDDHTGNLEEAIVTMERAFEKIKTKNPDLYCWTLSNLADMYGHAGQLDKAYANYLEVLRKDSTNLYCLKGIARIVWLKDNNTDEAKRIINFILSQQNMPDLHLLLAEINYSENNKTNGDKEVDKFLKIATAPEYGNMYNKDLITLSAERLNDIDKAIGLAEKEVTERPTPETYSWLSYAYIKKGELKKALSLIEKKVYQQTYEPQALMHAAFVFAANGKKEIAQTLLKECKASSYELGPIAIKEINNELRKM